MKVCPNCGVICHDSESKCSDCGYDFKNYTKAPAPPVSTSDILSELQTHTKQLKTIINILVIPYIVGIVGAIVWLIIWLYES